MHRHIPFSLEGHPDSQDTFEQFLNVQTLGFMKIGGWARLGSLS